MTVPPPRILQRSIITALVFGSIAVCAFIAWLALQANGAFGFPLDDSWIHLQFARNLQEFGSYSYYRNEMATSGSTSPLYTFLLAAGLFVTSNEFLLSYLLGVGFFAAGAVVLWRLGEGLFKGRMVFAGGVALLYLLDPRLEWIALSGMETTLFIFLLLLVWHFYREKSAWLLGIAAGLLLWTRPEALIFFAALALDVVYRTRWIPRQHAKKNSPDTTRAAISWLRTATAIAGVICLGYVGFNWILSGSVLPNTYAAKTAYYASGGKEFPSAVFNFLTRGHMPVLAVLAAIGLLDLLWRLVSRKPQEYLVPALWCAGLFLAYWQKLPFLYQEGRYLMPILPWIILLGVRGIEVAIELIQRRSTVLKKKTVHTGVAAALLVVLVVQFALAAWEKRMSHAEYCRYISERQVRTALWIRDHLPAQAVIGTHDVGAIAYYSGRRIVDMVGLVSPEMIQNIGSLDRLVAFLGRNRVTHLAVLRNWFEVANQNPLFTTDEATPEIMQVFSFDPIRCHFTPQNAGALISEASYYLSIGQVQTAGPMLEEALRLDPRSARATYHIGVALLTVGKNEEAERAMRTTLVLQPDAWPAMLALAHFALKRGKADSAFALYKEVQQKNPSFAPVYRALADFYLTQRKDTVSAQAYMSKYSELAGTTRQSP